VKHVIWLFWKHAAWLRYTGWWRVFQAFDQSVSTPAAGGMRWQLPQYVFTCAPNAPRSVKGFTWPALATCSDPGPWHTSQRTPGSKGCKWPSRASFSGPVEWH